MTGETEGLGAREGCYKVEGPEEITRGLFPEFHTVPVSKAQKPLLDQAPFGPTGSASCVRTAHPCLGHPWASRGSGGDAPLSLTPLHSHQDAVVMFWD